jgi:hypothetical protein
VVVGLEVGVVIWQMAKVPSKNESSASLSAAIAASQAPSPTATTFRICNSIAHPPSPRVNSSSDDCNKPLAAESVLSSTIN